MTIISDVLNVTIVTVKIVALFLEGRVQNVALTSLLVALEP